MNNLLGERNADKGNRSIGDEPTLRGGFQEIRIGMKIGPDGRYAIKDVLGKGGMGEVYLAFDDVAQMEVAIKLVPREVSASEDEMDQVRKNFALVNKLHHPHIAAVTALERLPSGECILIMEAVLGRRTLHKYRLTFANECLPLEKAIGICKQIAEALDYAHQQKVIHRDIKPSNVLLTQEGQVKLTDFGLAAQIMSSMNRVSLLPTRTSGTRPYMAPEQWEGRLQDGRTDQWALGVLFYELVTGRLPFPADDLAVLERQILERTPEKPLALTQNQWTCVLRALSKEKEGRFESCTAFLRALDANMPQRMPRARNRASVIPVAVVLALLAAGGLAAHWFESQRRVRGQKELVIRLQKEMEAAERTQREAAERTQRKAEERTQREAAYMAASKQTDLQHDANKQTPSAPTTDLVDNFNSTLDSKKWHTWGAPRPIDTLSNVGVGGTPAVDPNGDGWYESGIVSRQAIRLVPGLKVGVSAKLLASGQQQYHYQMLGISLTTKSPDSFGNETAFYEGHIGAMMVMRCEGENPTIDFHDGQPSMRGKNRFDARDTFGNWVRYEMEIQASGAVLYRKNGQEIFRSPEKTVDLSKTPSAYLVLAGRSVGCRNLFDDLIVVH